MCNPCYFLPAERIVVEYEFPEYTTSETMGYVELCAIVTSHPGGSPRPFVISATTADGSASMHVILNMICRVIFFNCPCAASIMDYTAIVTQRLVFAVGETRVCHRVQITQDNTCEIDREPFEDFFSNLQYESGEMPIIINRNQTRVLIDDSNEPECGKWMCIYKSKTFSLKG